MTETSAKNPFITTDQSQHKFSWLSRPSLMPLSPQSDAETSKASPCKKSMLTTIEPLLVECQKKIHLKNQILNKLSAVKNNTLPHRRMTSPRNHNQTKLPTSC